jgi:L-ascorbate metabolism protein UlaG (beta-lactamase superfamily)
MAIKITWHGHATYALDIDGTAVVVDPFFAPHNPAAKVTAADVDAAFILQTHGHGDHISDTMALAQRTGALVISNFEICNWVNSQGHDKTHALNIGGGYDFAFGRVTMTRALHSSGLPDGAYGGDPGGFLIAASGRKLYLTGDTALFSDMGLIARAGDIDLAILPIGDNYTMGPDDARLALDFIKPRFVIPGHYNTWPLIAQDVNAWAERVRQETDVQPVVLAVGESYRLE